MFGGKLRAVLWTLSVVVATLGCSAGRQFSANIPGLSPHRERLSIAHSYERIGELAKAKQVYDEILTLDPSSSVAKRRLEALVKVEQRMQVVAVHERHPKSWGTLLNAKDTTLASTAVGGPEKPNGVASSPSERRYTLGDAESDSIYGPCPVPAPIDTAAAIPLARLQVTESVPPSPLPDVNLAIPDRQTNGTVLSGTTQLLPVAPVSRLIEEDDEQLKFEPPIIRTPLFP